MDRPAVNTEALVAALSAGGLDDCEAWLAQQQPAPGLPMIEALKQHSDQLLTSDPSSADRLTRCALLIAERAADEPLSAALAAWARGNWEAYHEPHLAIDSYRRAIAGYQAIDDRLSIGRLQSNLIFAYTDCGRLSEAEAAYQAAQRVLSQVGADGALYLQALEQNRGWLLDNQGRLDEALAAYERALSLAHQLQRLDLAAEVQVNRAYTLGRLGRLTEGEAALLTERLVAEQQQQWLTVARIDMDLGELYAAQARPAEALRRLQTARAQFIRLGNQMEVASVTLREAELLESIGALREALHSYRAAQTQFAERAMQAQVGAIMIRRAATYRRVGNIRAAERLLDEAELLWRSLDQAQALVTIALERVAIDLAQQQPLAALARLDQLPELSHAPRTQSRCLLLRAEAQSFQWLLATDRAGYDAAAAGYQRALDQAREQGDRWLQRQALVGLGRLTLAADPGAARDALEAAAELDDELRLALSVEELKASFQTQTSDLLPQLAQLAVADGQPLLALRYAWRAKGSALLELLTAPDSAATLSAAEAQELETVRQQFAIRRWQASQEAASQPQADRERDDPELLRLEQRLSELRRLRNQRMVAPGALQLSDPALLLRRAGVDVLIEYVRCDDQLLAIRLDRDGNCRALSLGPTDAIANLLDELTLSMQNVLLHGERRSLHLRDWLDESLPLLQQLYQRLITPLGELPADAAALIAPCDLLQSLPFGALWDGRRYLIETCELQLTPCGALLTAPAPDGPTAHPLVIAASADRALPDTINEAAAIGHALPDAIVRVDAPRTLDELSGLTSAPRILHIAAHMLPRPDAPIFSALQLPDGLLSVEQCYQLPLAGSDLVVLSGCTTAAGLDSGGAVLAFQSALFVAGARHVVNSLWQIDDALTAVWMGRFYQALAAGATPVAALRATQRALLADPDFLHPALWAAFTCSRR
jgi:CHAT domain-containing protein